VSGGKFLVTRVLLALAVLATVVLIWGLGSPQADFLYVPLQWELSGSQGPQDDEKSQVKEFKGKIFKSDGRFVLEESSNGGNYGTYLLDDQAAAKKYDGQRVVVTGTLDAPRKAIHVQKIEAVA
jgi:Protein of unknown function (DUF5818)